MNGTTNLHRITEVEIERDCLYVGDEQRPVFTINIKAISDDGSHHKVILYANTEPLTIKVVDSEGDRD